MYNETAVASLADYTATMVTGDLLGITANRHTLLK